MDKQRTMLVIPLPPNFHRLVRIEAAKRGESMAKFARSLLEKELEKKDRKNERQPA